MNVTHLALARKLAIYFLFRLKRDAQLLRSRIALFVFNLIPDLMTLCILRNFILFMGGATVSIWHAYIRSPLYATNLHNLSVGKGVFINIGCRFDGAAPIRIGDRCQIGPFVSIECVNHFRHGDEVSPVTVGNSVWIGTRCVILPGVSIGDEVIIGAGAVVTRDIPYGETWVGVPAKKIA